MTLAKLSARNTKIFLRDRTSVFFSFLSMLIILMLYVLFLGEVNVSSIKAQVGDVPGIRWLIDSWIMAGILVVNSVTVTLGVLGGMVSDREEKRLSGFLVAPVGRLTLTAGHLLSALFVGVLMNLVTFALSQVYILLSGGQLLPVLSMLKVLGLIVANVFSGSALVLFLISFVRSNGAFGALSTMIGTLIGFLTGIYMPIGILPEAIQTITKLIPATHGAVMMRRIFMEQPMAQVFKGAPASVVTAFEKEMGCVIPAGGGNLSDGVMLLVLILSGCLFLGLATWRFSKKGRE